MKATRRSCKYCVHCTVSMKKLKNPTKTCIGQSRSAAECGCGPRSADIICHILKKYFPRHVNPKWALLGRRQWPGQSVHSGHWWTLNVVAGSGSPVKEFSQKFSFFLHFLFFITNKQFGFSKDPLTLSNDDFCGQTFQLKVWKWVGE